MEGVNWQAAPEPKKPPPPQALRPTPNVSGWQADCVGEWIPMECLVMANSARGLAVEAFRTAVEQLSGDPTLWQEETLARAYFALKAADYGAAVRHLAALAEETPSQSVAASPRWKARTKADFLALLATF